MSRYFRRVPDWKQIVAVYAVIVLMIYSWTILWFYWKLPSWLHFLNAGEILTVGAYALATNLLESATVLCALVVASLILPRRWLSDSFVARGTALAVSGVGYMMYIDYQFKTKDDYPDLVLKPWSLAVALVAVLLIAVLSGRIAIVRKALELIADRATIFVYIFIPLSILALLAVVVRWVI
jgi:hypothetical protein